jgi:hypothetical protein
MKIWIIILKAFGYIWLIAAVILILVGLYGIWLKGGFSAVQEILSPFNVINWVATLITVAPGLGAIAWANKLKEKQITQQGGCT